MTCHKNAVVLLVGSLMAFTSSAGWVNWKTNPEDNHDWTNPNNFTAGKAPSIGDIIVVPEGLEVMLSPSDSASWDLLDQESTRVQLRNSGSYVVFDIAEDTSANFTGTIQTCWDEVYVSKRHTGGVKKRGDGSLTIVAGSDENSFYTDLIVEGGELTYEFSSEQRIGKISVNEGCTMTIGGTGSMILDGYVGAGTIVRNPTLQDYVIGNSYRMDYVCEFSGRLRNVYPWVGNKQHLTGERSSGTSWYIVRNNADKMMDGPYLGVKKFGVLGETSSIGVTNLTFGEGGAYVRYLGTGETTDKSFLLTRTSGGHAVLDAGETGGLIWNGNMLIDAWRNEHLSFIFTGDNKNVCVFSGIVSDQMAGYGRKVYITKDGTGTWRFNGNKYYNKNDIGGIAVKNGTLQFDSIAEKGINCALGMASVMMEDYSGADAASDHTVPYAYILGGNGDALMEYVGSTAVSISTRPAVLNGRGGFKSSSAEFSFSGVTSKGTGANTLILDGETVVNTVRNVTNGTGTVGIEKRGSGTWNVAGYNDFSGPVAVKAGTLKISSVMQPYRWYRFNIEQVFSTTNNCVELRYLGLFDKDGLSVSDGMTKGSSVANLQPGQVYANYMFCPTTGDTVMGGDMDKAFVYDSSLMGGYFLKTASPWVLLRPRIDDETLWARVVFRLPESANPATTYDFLRTSRTSGWNFRAKYQIWAWSLDASLDGQTWTTLSASQFKEPGANYGVYRWASDDVTAVDYTNYVHTTGMSIESSVLAGSLPASTEWSVDGGATIYNDNTTSLTVNRLDIDAAKGVGTLVNFAFANDGTLSLANHSMEKSGDSVTVNCGFDQTTGFANVATWTLLVDGVESTNFGFTVSGNSITFTKRKQPTILLLR